MPGLFQRGRHDRYDSLLAFTVLSDKTLLFLGDFDGEFSQLMADLAKHAGPVVDAIFKHVNDPPSTPVADLRRRFCRMDSRGILSMR